MLIGLGGLGLRVLRHLRLALRARFGSLEAIPHLRWLYVDTDPDGLARAVEEPTGAEFQPSEVLLLRLNRANYYMRPRPNQVPLENWFNPRMLYRIPRSQLTAGLRCLGRLAFFDGYRYVADRLRAELKALGNRRPLETADEKTHLGIAAVEPRVYVIAGLAGGTGSGMFMDVGYLVRGFGRQLGLEVPEVVSLLLLPPADPNPDRIMAVGNTYAALTELNHFSTPGAMYSAWYEVDSPGLSDRAPPFDRVALAVLTKEADDEPVPRWLSLSTAYLFRELVTPLGRAVDGCRKERRPSAPGGATPYHAFGLYRFTWPRASLVEQTAGELARRLVQHWIAKGSPGILPAVKARITELLAEQPFGMEGVMATIDAACTQVLGKSATVLFDAVTERLVGKGATGVDEAAVVETLRHLDQLVGPPGKRRGSQSKLNLLNLPPPSALDGPLEEATRFAAEAWHKQLLQTLFSIMEDPQYRLAGVEVAAGQLGSVLKELVLTAERAVPGLHVRADETYDRITAQLGNLKGFASWFRNKTAAVNDLTETLRQYPRLRYQAMLGERACDLGRHLVSSHPEFSHDINISRGRLGDFLRMLADPVTPRAPTEVELGPGRELHPPGCGNRAETCDQILERMTPTEMLAFDRQVQEVVQKEFTSLWQICLAPSTNVFEDLERVVRQQARLFVDNILEGISAVDFYLRTHPDEAKVVEEMATAFAQAAPDLTRGSPPPPVELYVVGTPPGPAAEQFGRFAAQAAPGKELTMAVTPEDIVFLREQLHVALAGLEQVGPAARDAYRQLTAVDGFTPHSRTDITDWTPLVHEA